MLLQQLVVIKALITSSAPVLVVPSVLTLMVTQTLYCGKTFTTLITDKTLLAVVRSFMDVLQVS